MNYSETPELASPIVTGLEPAAAVAVALAAVEAQAMPTGDDRTGGLAGALRLLQRRLRAHSTLTRVLNEGVKACQDDEDPLPPGEADAIRTFCSPVAESARVLAAWAAMDSHAFGAAGKEGLLLAEFEDAANWLGIQAAELRERLVDLELTPSGDDN